MTSATPRERCLGELELDRLLAGDQDPALHRHAETCERCRRQLAELAAQRDAHMTPAHVSAQASAILTQLGTPAPAPPPSRWRAWWPAAPVLALAAAVALALWPRRPDIAAPQPPDQIRVKGAARLDVIVVDPGPPRVVSDGEALAAGATLSFRVACPAGCWAALFAASAGGVTALADQVPPPWQVPPGAPVQLPVSVTLDDAPGGDRVVAVLCVRAPDVAALRAALAPPGAPSPATAGCEVRTHRIAIARRGAAP